MIKLGFIGPQRKVIKFEIENRKVVYFDDNWKKGVQFMPKDQNTVERFRRSHNMNMKMLAALIIDANKGKQLKEYEDAKTDEEIAEIIRKDCKLQGLMEVK